MKNLDYWIGLNDIDNEDMYYWDSLTYDILVSLLVTVRQSFITSISQSVSQYVSTLQLSHFYDNWADGQPDDASHTKNCVAVQFNGTNSAWYL